MITTVVATFLVGTLLVGLVPYLWMLNARRGEIVAAKGTTLTVLLHELPLAMLPFYWKFWLVLFAMHLGAVLLLPQNEMLTGLFPIGLMLLVIGTISVPLVGYVYLGITLGFLRVWQWLGIVQR